MSFADAKHQAVMMLAKVARAEGYVLMHPKLVKK